MDETDLSLSQYLLIADGNGKEAASYCARLRLTAFGWLLLLAGGLQ